MSELPALVTDLALILMAAGAVTLIFKRLGQPLVLGYIVAGFLAGPHMPFTPTVTDAEGIKTWADLGVIFLMFTLGLDFSFKRILKMGARPVVAACLTMACMIGVGNMVGHAFGWDKNDCLFLGGMLAMSSTTIIYKAFDDMGLQQQKFTGEVLSVLVLEDILGILLMVILSAVSVARSVEGTALVGSLLKLGFFLILWFIVGVYIVPILLRKGKRWMNNETLLIVAVGLCFTLVVMASRAGYSSAFGAFMMGSILAETLEAETIERVVTPVKDLFGAIFFVSVGMLVDPAILAAYWLPILVITVAVIVGQMIFGTASFIVSGQSLRVAMQCGFSLAQIGEFAFIIASLGIALGVTGEFLYPVVVAVSIITTFLTPYMIKAASPAYDHLQRLLPTVLQQHLSRSRTPAAAPSSAVGGWRTLLGALLAQLGIYTTLSIAVIAISLGVLLSVSRTVLTHWPGNVVCGIATVIIAAPFLRAMVMRKNHSEEWKLLSARGKKERLLLRLTIVVRALIAAALVLYVLDFLSPVPSPFRWPVHCLTALLIVLLIVRSRRVKYASIRLERTFLNNLRSRDVQLSARGEKGPRYARRLLSHNVHIAQLTLPANSRWGGKTLKDLNLSHRANVLITAIVRSNFRINIPEASESLFPNDRLEVLGDDDSIAQFSASMQAAVVPLPANNEQHRLRLRRLQVKESSPLCHATIAQSGLKNKHHCLVVGLEADDGTIVRAEADQTIEKGDLIWLVGEEDDLKGINLG